MKRICKYNQNNLYNNCKCYNSFDRKLKYLYYNMYGIGNTLNCFSKLYNIKKIVTGINGFKR